ncbi:Molybdopterin synthase catalytic subunit [Colletotrichum sp. SAR 10_70]|nr:Molybdopterin synthase catalytic subunit [Colletotrichum sp. SAR 10_71]KAI8195812.1 Molybdopterin synthase catalytic subunit [Colletotrichum sp. SAR 10_70]KAI8197861.1 Molybdopterin synthase catalytic subunit [Colletotrichum sp. SAR 10_65]
MDSQGQGPWEVAENSCYVALTYDLLDAAAIMNRVRSPQAGAIVLFSGTTRDTFGDKPVKELQYSAYTPLALRTMMSIAKSILQKHGLKGVAMIHRLGTVPIGEESILIAVSSPHRQAAWRAGEEALEECKAKVEVWKREEFHGEEGVWRANRDGIAGQKVTNEQKAPAEQNPDAAPPPASLGPNC